MSKLVADIEHACWKAKNNRDKASRRGNAQLAARWDLRLMLRRKLLELAKDVERGRRDGQDNNHS